MDDNNIFIETGPQSFLESKNKFEQVCKILEYIKILINESFLQNTISGK